MREAVASVKTDHKVPKIDSSPLCPPPKNVTVRDFNDLITWVKDGKPKIECSHSGNETIFRAIKKISQISKSRNGMAVIPVEDGFAYNWVAQSNSESSILVRRPSTSYDFMTNSDVLRKVFLPDAGIYVLSQYDYKQEETQLHGLGGYYGYDHFDEDYFSPTGTNAEEDLVFNITMVSSLMDSMMR